MRQLLVVVLSLGSLAAFGETVVDSPQAIVNKRIQLAQDEIQKIAQLVQAGALPKLRSKAECPPARGVWLPFSEE